MKSLALLMMLAVAGCTQMQQDALNQAVAKSPTAQRIVADGQLFCAKATADGPMVVAVADMLGAPIIVTGLASDVVAGVCKSINAIPVSPPADPAQAPVVAAPVPAPVVSVPIPAPVVAPAAK